MSTRDIAINIVNMMDEEQIDNFVNLFNPLVSNIPNDETIEAMKETEELLKSGNAKKFNTVKELFEDLKS